MRRKPSPARDGQGASGNANMLVIILVSPLIPSHGLGFYQRITSRSAQRGDGGGGRGSERERIGLRSYERKIEQDAHKDEISKKQYK